MAGRWALNLGLSDSPQGESMDYPLFQPLQERKSMVIRGYPLWAQSGYTGPKEGRDRDGLLYSVVLANPQALIGSGQQMVPEGQTAIQRAFH